MDKGNNRNLPESALSTNGVDRKEVATPDDTQGGEQLGETDSSAINSAKAQTMTNANKAALQKSYGPIWHRLNLRGKATILAIAISTLPVVLTGAASYYFANRNITQRIAKESKERVTQMGDKVNRFFTERYVDIQDMASLSIFTEPKLRELVTVQQKEEALKGIINRSKSSGTYNSLAIFEMNGDLIAQGESKKIILPNHKSRDYFQEVLKTDKPAIAQPRPSKTTGVFSLHFAAPVKDTVTGKSVAIIRSRSTVKDLENVIRNYGREGQTDYVLLVEEKQQAFISMNDAWEGENFFNEFPALKAVVEQRKPKVLTAVGKQDGIKRLITYVPIPNVPGQPELNWGAVLLTNTSVAFAAQRDLLRSFSFGTAITAILVGFLAAYLADRATRPILASAKAVEKLGQGELDTRIPVKGQDELAILGSNINLMADQIQTLLAEQEEATTEQMVAQTEIARQQTKIAQQQRQQKEALQRELSQLLNDVEGASSGDLTVRAEISTGEIGIVADFFNSIIESLRGIVTQVKQAASQVNISVGENEVAISQLADEAIKQATEINQTLNAVEKMTLSIQEVADNARTAAEVARIASATAQTGGAAMDRSVQSILQLRSTVAETAKKVKRLGESSQQISQVISLINEIALKTNLLAVNASIEAARAGEEGRGFAVVAEEVGELAEQSATATRDIEQIVANIQLGTNEVVQAMELGTAQVVEGTSLVEETKQSLEQIVEVSGKIDQLLQSISSATVSQAETSQVVRKLMEEISQISEQTSNSSGKVSSSLQQTVEIAEQLQESVGKFKVEEV
ncbi:MAG: methyl-accepting chemotaxis protein [Xenococcaceae cyanobacterium]